MITRAVLAESIIAATLGLSLTGVFFGALALAPGAATGSTGVARGVPAATNLIRQND